MSYIHMNVHQAVSSLQVPSQSFSKYVKMFLLILISRSTLYGFLRIFKRTVVDGNTVCILHLYMSQILTKCTSGHLKIISKCSISIK